MIFGISSSRIAYSSVWICHYRLYRNLLESKVCKMKNILGEIQIVVGKGSSYVILVLVSGLCKFLKLRQNQIIASLPLCGMGA